MHQHPNLGISLPGCAACDDQRDVGDSVPAVVDEQLIDDARGAVTLAACLACPPGGADDYVDRAGLRDLVRAVARYRAVRNSYLAGGEEGMKR